MDAVSLSTSLFFAVLLQIGMGLAVGSSTFAVIFYFKAKRDGVIDATERSFLHIVYTVLRIAFLLIFASLFVQSIVAYRNGVWSDFTGGTYWMMWIVLAVILTNALLMDWHVMPMSVGPAIAVGSWYTLYLVFTLRTLGLDEIPLMLLVIYYLLFLVFMVFFLRLVEKLVVMEGGDTPPPRHNATEGSKEEVLQETAGTTS